jgi:hypothetical protein
MSCTAIPLGVPRTCPCIVQPGAMLRRKVVWGSKWLEGLHAPARSGPGGPRIAIAGQHRVLDSEGMNRAQLPTTAGTWQRTPTPANKTGPLAQRLEQETHNHPGENPNDCSANGLTSPPCGADSACASAQVATPANTCPQADSELAQVVDAWADLPQHIKAAVLALVSVTTRQAPPGAGGVK